MPVLPTYSAQVGGVSISGGRRASAEDLFAGNPNAGKATLRAAQGFVNDLEDDEARKAVVSSTEIRAKYAKLLDEAQLSGGDVDKLKEQMQADLDAVGENFQTKKGVDSLRVVNANTSLMFDEQANRIKVSRAREDAKVEAGKFVNKSAAIIQSNPLYLKEAEAQADALAETFTKIPAEQRKEIANGLRKELNMSAALGSSRIAPEETKRKLEAGEWDLTPEQRQVAINKADTEMRAKRADEDHQRALDEYEARKADDAARDKHFASIIDGTVTRRSIMDDPDLKPQTREHLITFMEARSKELRGQEKASNPTVKRDLWLRIHAADGDPRKIYGGAEIVEAVSKGLLNTTDANTLNADVANQKDENNRSIGQRLGAFNSTVGRALSADQQFVAQPALVASIQLDLAARVEDKIKEFREEKKNPNDLFNPASKDYVGTRDFIQQSIDKAKADRAGAARAAIRVNSKEEYDALEPGTPYIDSDGKTGVKSGVAKPAAKPAPNAGPTTFYIPSPSGGTPAEEAAVRAFQQKGR